MGNTTKTLVPLTLEAHQALGRRLRGLKAEAVALREAIKGALGSATIQYQTAGRVITAVQALQNALAAEAAGQYAGEVPTDQLRALYDGDGEGR